MTLFEARKDKEIEQVFNILDDIINPSGIDIEVGPITLRHAAVEVIKALQSSDQTPKEVED